MKAAADGGRILSARHPLQATLSASSAPLVSVIIPCFNQETYLSAAIECIFAQTHNNIEVVVIDDGSMDGTARVAEKYGSRIRFIRQKNTGASAARNAGIKASKGKYVQYLDGDDLIERDKIRAQLEYLEDNPSIGIVYSDARYFTDEEPWAREHGPFAPEPGKPWIHKLWEAPGSMIDKLIHRNLLPVNCALVRRSIVEAVGPWNESLDAVEDWEYWIRCADAGVRFMYLDLPEALSLIRLRAGSTSTQTERVSNAQFQMTLWLARTLKSPYAQKVNCSVGIWWADKLPGGSAERYFKLFSAMPSVSAKARVIFAFAIRRHWPNYPFGRYLKMFVSKLRRP